MGKTYPRVTELLKKEFEEKGVTKYAFCKQTGINPTSVERYLCGISEPNQSSLEKLAEYFDVSVPWLRGEVPFKTFRSMGSAHDMLIHEWDSLLKADKLKGIVEEDWLQIEKGTVALAENQSLKEELDRLKSANNRLDKEIKMRVDAALVVNDFLHLGDVFRPVVDAFYLTPKHRRKEALLLLETIYQELFTPPPAATE